MSASVVRRWAGCVAGWALPIVACVLLAPETARASCGDYVVINGRPSNVMAHHGAMPAEPGASAPARGPAKPCSGPTCSARPHEPLAPVPTNPPPPSQEWGALGEPLDYLLPSPTARVTGE